MDFILKGVNFEKKTQFSRVPRFSSTLLLFMKHLFKENGLFQKCHQFQEVTSSAFHEVDGRRQVSVLFF